MKKWVRRAFSIHARGYWRAACRMQLGRGTLTCEGSREPQNPDSAWKSRIWVGSGGWKEENKVTPGHQREWLGDGGTVLPDPECRRKPGVLPLFPFLLCPAGLISTDGSIGLPVLWLLVSTAAFRGREEGATRAFIPRAVLCLGAGPAALSGCPEFSLAP